MSNNIYIWDEQEIVRNIGQRVKKRREIMELTQEKLAEMMDIPGRDRRVNQSN